MIEMSKYLADAPSQAHLQVHKAEAQSQPCSTASGTHAARVNTD